MSVNAVAKHLADGFDGVVKRDEPLARHTTFRIGGPAALFVECDSTTDVGRVVAACGDTGVEWTVLGKGSNVLASDAGYDGVVVVLGKEFKRHRCDGERIVAGGGVILAALVQDAFRMGLTGLEFAVGIPGTLGGALAMNAGSRDAWIGSIVESVTVQTPNRGLVAIRGPEVSWGYRRSGLQDLGVVIEASLRLEQGDTAQIRRVMEASLRRRKRSQPLAVPNAGSVFVNPDGESAGRLIEGAGLKGLRVGDAMVSDVHANFIVNAGRATASDVLELIRQIRQAVEDSYGIELKPEIRFLGSFDLA